LTNESNVNQKMSPFCADEEEEKPNVELLDEKPSTNLQILAALASKNFKSEDKPLEIFIPLATCSDEDESLSPVQKKILSPSASINRHPKNRSSRQSTHDAEDSHAHTSKQLKTQAGIELCRRRMLKYIANNMYTSQIVQFSRNSRSNSRSNLGSFEKVNNQEEVEEIMNEQATIEKSDEMDKPKPLNLYPNGEEFVTKSGSRGRRNSKKQTMLVGKSFESFLKFIIIIGILKRSLEIIFKSSFRNHFKKQFISNLKILYYYRKLLELLLILHLKVILKFLLWKFLEILLILRMFIIIGNY
jgi:hypothetical protein